MTSVCTLQVARPRGFEPLTFASGGQRSIQLSYGRIGAKYTRNSKSPQRMTNYAKNTRGTRNLDNL